VGNVEEKDTTYRLTRTTTFNGRVEPIWMHFSKTKDKRGMIGSFFEKRRVKSLISSIHDNLAAQRANGGTNWDREDGECIANMKVDKMGFLQELRSAVGRKIPPSQMARVEHFTRVREWNAFFLPVDFAQPFDVPGAIAKEVIPVGSSVRLLEELQLIGEILGAGKKMNVEKMPPFMQMKQEDVEKADQKAVHDPTFWPVFSFCILKKLADLSVQHNLPIVLA
jgi:hypothetical protein